MPSKQQQGKAKKRAYYAANKTAILARKRERYASNKTLSKKSVQEYYLKNRKEILNMAARTYVTIHAAYKKKYNHSYYRKHRESILARQKLYRQLLACAKARSMKKNKACVKTSPKVLCQTHPASLC